MHHEMLNAVACVRAHASPTLLHVAQEPQPLPETLSIRDIRKQRSAARLDDFTIQPDLGGPRLWHVHGTALQRFAQMTNWDYYEATARFQRVLENSGESMFHCANGQSCLTCPICCRSRHCSLCCCGDFLFAGSAWGVCVAQGISCLMRCWVVWIIPAALPVFLSLVSSTSLLEPPPLHCTLICRLER